MAHTRSRRGSTLLEILAVAGLLVTLLSGLVSLGITAAGEYSRGSSRMMADNLTSLTLQKLVRDMHDGLSATVKSSTEVVIVRPAVNGEGDYDRFSTGVSVRYFLSNGTLYRQAGTNTATVLGRDVSLLQFVSEANTFGTRLKITLACKQQHGSKVKESSLTTHVTLRNEFVE